MARRNEKKEIEVSPEEKEVLKEIVHSERENVRVFNLPNRREQSRYEKLLDGLDKKFTA